MATQIEVLKAALAAEKAEKEKALADKSAPPLSLLLLQDSIIDTTEVTFAAVQTQLAMAACPSPHERRRKLEVWMSTR